ncbi:hypothetical protein [Enterococcus timonensis]|uniref:hypothetical protein n=1 Tax=Enterococcus timonensis TaxID=1852364 RepID=UPI0008DA7ED0|nr:hypothetical protein [Enterococcus timonensis]
MIERVRYGGGRNVSKNQIDFMKANEFKVNFDSELSDEDFIKIEEKASYLLQIKGFDKYYDPTYTGIMCESIIDVIE